MKNIFFLIFYIFASYCNRILLTSKDQKGSSIVSILISLGVIGISTSVLVAYVQGFQKQTIPLETEKRVSFNIHHEILSHLQALLMETRIDADKTKKDQSTWGVCSFLNKINKISGVEPLLFNIGTNLTNQSKRSFSETRWKNFFSKSEYEISVSGAPCKKIDSSFQSNYFERCFKYLGEQSKTANEIYVIARIVPKDFLKSSSIDLTVNNTLDPKGVFFELQSHVAIFKNNNIVSPSRQYRIVWANSVTECHIKSTSDKWVIVQFSGSGTGRLSQNTVINSQLFSDLDMCSDLEYRDIPPHTIISYKTLENGTIASDHSHNVRLACRRKIYKCPGVSAGKTRYYTPISFNVGLTNNSGGVLNVEKVKINFVKANLAGSKTGSQISSLKVGAFDRVKEFETNKNLTNIFLNPGHSVFRFTATDKATDSLGSFCENVCMEEEYFPWVKIDLKKPPDALCTSYSSNYTDDKYRLRCIACHSKICTKQSIGAFGPIKDEGNVQGLVDEPLDGTIPECKLPLNTETEKYKLPDISDGSGDCVAMEVSNIESFKNFKSASYKFNNCTSQLPVLCFAYGHYIPAMSISATGEPAIFTGSFNEAQEACYEIGREIILKKNLAGYFRKFWPDIGTLESITETLNLPVSSTDSNYFDYINNASRGIFVVPNYNIGTIAKRLSEGSNSYLQKFIDGKYEKIWVAIEKDTGKQIIGSIPRAVTADSTYAIFNRKEEPFSPVLLKNTAISDSGTKVVLTHNIQYKGVMAVNDGNYPVLCRKDYGDFVLVTDSKLLTEAINACKQKGAHFLPPVSSLEWIKAMTLLNSNSEMYPFPDPGDLSGDNYIHSRSIFAPKVWVGLSKAGSGTSAQDYRLSEGYFPDKNGKKSIFHLETQDIPAGSTDYVGIIDEKGRHVVPSLTATFFKDFLFSNYQKACYKDKGNDQVELEASVSANNSCSNKSIENKSDIDAKRKSIRFMSEWVTLYYDSPAEFIIERDKVDQLVVRANNIWCKKKECPECKSDCASDASSCGSSCPTVTSTDANCVANCPPGNNCNCTTSYPSPSCISDCNTEKNICIGGCFTCNGVKYSSCDQKCDCKHDCSGHPWTDILSYP